MLVIAPRKSRWPGPNHWRLLEGVLGFILGICLVGDSLTSGAIGFGGAGAMIDIVNEEIAASEANAGPVVSEEKTSGGREGSTTSAVQLPGAADFRAGEDLGPERGQLAPGSGIPGLPEGSGIAVTSASFDARHWLSFAATSNRRRPLRHPSAGVDREASAFHHEIDE